MTAFDRHLSQLTNMIKDSSLVNKYEEPWYRFYRSLQALEKVSGLPPIDSNWLDLGCNLGQFMSIVSEKYGVRTSGIDDWDPLRASDTFLGTITNKNGWHYYQRDLALGFDIDEKFEFISALEVLEHMVDTDLFLERCWNSLSKGGYLLITTPNINSLRNRLLVPFGQYPVGLEYKNIIHHVRLYNLPTLLHHLTEHRFEVKLAWGLYFLKQNHVKNAMLRLVSESLSSFFPQMSGSLIVVCQKSTHD